MIFQDADSELPILFSDAHINQPQYWRFCNDLVWQNSKVKKSIHSSNDESVYDIHSKKFFDQMVMNFLKKLTENTGRKLTNHQEKLGAEIFPVYYQ